MTEDEISSLLSELAGVDTQDTDLRHHPDAYAAVETALAPLLQDLAAHEASNRIKTENLETLREQNAKLREALERLVDTSARVSKLGAMTGPQWLPFGVAITRARAALGESNGNG